MQQFEERRLALLKRQTRQLESARQELIRSLNAEDILEGALLYASVRKLASVACEIDRSSAAQEAQSRQTVAQTVRSKVAERLYGLAVIEDRRIEERQELIQVIERALLKMSASLP